MSTEKELKKLEDEITAQKAVFEKMAAQLPVYTKSVNFKTKANPMHMDQGGSSYNFDGNERVVVTFATDRGSNTVATLEMTVTGFTSDLKVKRVPYTGGARWIVYNTPTYGQVGGTWQRIDTIYDFTVQSAVSGTLGAKMIWE